MASLGLWTPRHFAVKRATAQCELAIVLVERQELDAIGKLAERALATLQSLLGDHRRTLRALHVCSMVALAFGQVSGSTL
jgi:hypothetical protein